MSARAWRGRKPGPFRVELRDAQASARARRNPGKWVRTSFGLICFDEVSLFRLPVKERHGHS